MTVLLVEVITYDFLGKFAACMRCKCEDTRGAP